MSGTNGGMSRRTFFDMAAGVTGVALASGKLQAQAASKTGPMGASERVRIALIGTGNRGREVSGVWTKNAGVPELHYVAACDVWQTRLEQGIKMLTDNQGGVKVDPYDDYRRVLDRKDIDAVHVATPDHWHIQIVKDAMSAGKDIYVEKPLSNKIEVAADGLRAYRAQNGARIVQFGTQQRSAQIFQEAARIVQDGTIGKVTNVVCAFPGNGYGTPPPDPVIPVPAGLNWEMWQGPAPRHQFQQGRLRWRGWWDYGGGLMTDWGVHLTQVALWYLNQETTPPQLSTGVGQYVAFENPSHDESPDSVFNTWQYPDFAMSFQNVAEQDFQFGRQGNIFFGTKGSLHVHRQGYEVRPPMRVFRNGTEPTDLAKYHMVPWRELLEGDTGSMTLAHGQNFVASIKERKAAIVDLEKGFYASLPCLLGVKAVREGKAFRWDDAKLEAVPA